MKVMMAFAAGFIVGRTIYVQYDKEQKKEAEPKKKVVGFLKDNGIAINPKEIENI